MLKDGIRSDDKLIILQKKNMLLFLEYKEGEGFSFDSLYKPFKYIGYKGPADKQLHTLNCSFTLRSQII